ncbi:import inner membrane translocase subunit isoform X2 [Tasmannia lanceolata]|uniref:import inner membrane translocase subunit isoform X2 n=1 Tax=Tasmannia lanceolata TaxID=3420 RepID=UPI0040632CB9
MPAFVSSFLRKTLSSPSSSFLLRNISHNHTNPYSFVPNYRLRSIQEAKFIHQGESNLLHNDLSRAYGIHTLSGRQSRIHMLRCFVRTLASTSASQTSGQTANEGKRKDISTIEDPFDAPTYNIPEKPVTFTEGASYSVIILAGLGIAGAAAYAVFKELIFQPKEYKIFGKGLERVQNDSQVRARIGSPITGYGSESRNRAARQRIPNRAWTDEDGVEHVEINFYIRGPHGAGKVYTEMFKDKVDKQWKYTYLIVEIKSPSPAQLMLESYVPA